MFLTLAELYNKRKSRQAKRSERRMSSLIGSDVDSKLDSRYDKGCWDQGGKESYLAWCMIKSAHKNSAARRALQSFASTANTPELTRPLSEKVLQDLPDVVLLDLYPQSKSLEALASKPVVLPTESLLPSRQYRATVNLNWFKIISYYHRLVQRCYWQKVSLGVSESHWALHYNCTTAAMHARAKATYNFLCTHCVQFRGCLIPSLPQLSMLPSTSISNAPAAPHREPHLVAGEMDVTIIWCINPLPSSLLQAGKKTTADESSVPASDRITGYFALNLKPVNFPMHSEPHVLGMETHVVHASLRRLTDLHGSWKELARAMSAYLDSKASMRPLSRSTSKQKRAEKSLQPPEELMKGITKAVRDAASFFDSKAKEVYDM